MKQEYSSRPFQDVKFLVRPDTMRGASIYGSFHARSMLDEFVYLPVRNVFLMH
jgi:hypothetical protein